jgi:geranylgeranyl pyrophosphate synthase
MAFQLVDDVLDYTGASSGKSLLTDLREGKLTLPLVLAVGELPSLLPLLERIRGGDEASVPGVSRAVVESGACEEVRRRARAYTTQAITELQAAPPGPARALLRAVAEELAARVS